jgi:hypothetical protein
MQQDTAWHNVDSVARGQFRTFSELSDSIRMPAQVRRRVLALSGEEWNAWTAFLADGELPEQPALPDMLIRLGAVTYRLANFAEQRGAAR